MTRHKHDRLYGVVEAALNHCMSDEKWLRDVAASTDPIWDIPDTPDGVYQALEDYICNHLARLELQEAFPPDTALGMCNIAHSLLERADMNPKIVNNLIDNDSIVEHRMDIDLQFNGYDWSYQLTVLRL